MDVNIESAINQCLEVVDNEEDIILDVVVCGYSKMEGKEISKHAFKNWLDAY